VTIRDTGPRSRDGAIFMVRAWREGDRFLARITSTLDVHHPAETATTVVDSAEDLQIRFALWLADAAQA
jgi:hypothetical protein